MDQELLKIAVYVHMREAQRKDAAWYDTLIDFLQKLWSNQTARRGLIGAGVGAGLGGLFRGGRGALLGGLLGGGAGLGATPFLNWWRRQQLGGAGGAALPDLSEGAGPESPPQKPPVGAPRVGGLPGQ